jgi:hypothetical protein
VALATELMQVNGARSQVGAVQERDRAASSDVQWQGGSTAMLLVSTVCKSLEALTIELDLIPDIMDTRGNFL